MTAVHTLWMQDNGEDLVYGPFYFCSADCRQKWIKDQGVEKECTVDFEERELTDERCDWCNMSSRL